MDGIVIKSAVQLRNAIGLTPVGKEVELTYERKGSLSVTRVRIEPRERTAAKVGRNHWTIPQRDPNDDGPMMSLSPPR